MELDDRLTVAGAEGIDLELSLAGIASRGSAFLTDLVIETLALGLVWLAVGVTGQLGPGLLAIFVFLLYFGYPTLAEAFWGGRTLGKALFRLRAVGVDGSPLTFLQAAIRNVVRIIDALPGVYLVGIVSILATEKSQRVGDLAASTLVVHVPRPVGPTQTWAGGFAPAPPPLDMAGWDVSAVSADEVAAARSFLLRRGELAPAARLSIGQSIAGQLLPKVAGVPLDGGPEAFLERIVAAKTLR